VNAPYLLQADLRNRTHGDSICRKKSMEGVSISLKNNKEFNLIHVKKYKSIKIHTFTYNPLILRHVSIFLDHSQGSYITQAYVRDG